MAVSPILLNTLPFDATQSHNLQFTYSGSQIFAHRVVIRNNLTNTVVYDVKTSAMVSYATIPANTLTNGTTYNFRVSVFDYANVESPFSNVVILKCLATPTFNFGDITSGYIVKNSYVDVTISYSQANDELLNAYTVYLYGSNQSTIIYDSGLKYADAGLTTKISGLTDDGTYYLRATGETVNGMEIDTGLVQIICDYIKPDIFFKFNAENVQAEGAVRLSAAFVLVEGTSEPESLVYIDNEKVSLLNGEKVYFNDGFVVNDFILKVVLENMIDFSNLITIDMDTVKANLTWNYGYFQDESTDFTDKKYYVALNAYQFIGTEKLEYIQTSNRLSPLSTGEQIHIWIKHIDGRFDLIVEKIT